MKAPAILALAALSATLAHANPDHLPAKRACQFFVQKQLRTPSVARFEPLSSVAAAPMAGKPGHWESVGWVDSQNGFGAMLRSDYICELKKHPNGDWQLVSLYIGKLG